MPSPFCHTKIIITLGPATESEEMLARLIDEGVDVIRLNMAHASHDWVRQMIRRIRAVSGRMQREVALLMDIKGPEIRTGDLPVPLSLERDDLFDFVVPGHDRVDSPAAVRSVGVNYPDLIHDLKIGDDILVDNGLIAFKVMEKLPPCIRCRVVVPGLLTSRRHINLPGVRISLPSLTDKDRADLKVGLEEGIDFVALSFVREAADIRLLREFLGERATQVRIVAKIEDQSAIANLDEIVTEADAVMVARGDLGIECPFEELPVIQRRVVNTCLARGRPVIIATHMLESMITQAVPTRAEVTDVAHAVFERADCLMLSGETSVGRYPFECVSMLKRISRRIESEDARESGTAGLVSDKLKVLHSAVVLANQVPNAKLLTFTRRGFMAAGLAALRPVRAPIFAFTHDRDVFRRMRLLRSVQPFFMPLHDDSETMIAQAMSLLRQAGLVHLGDKLIVATDIVAADRLVDSVQLRIVA